MPYSECPIPYSSVFWLEMPHLEEYLYTNLIIFIWGREFKANVVIHALSQMPFSLQQYVLLKMPYLEQYLYTKLGRPSYTGQRKSTPVRTHRIQGKYGYLCLYRVKTILLWLKHIQFKANVVICTLLQMPQQRKSCSIVYIEFKANVVIWALLQMPYSIQQYVLLGMPKMWLFGVQHSEQDMQLYRAIQSKAQLFEVPQSEYQHNPEPGS